jgi:hypothetical protein
MIHARDIKPSFILKTNGFVNDFVIDNNKLYVATDEGVVDVHVFLKNLLILFDNFFR